MDKGQRLIWVELPQFATLLNQKDLLSVNRVNPIQVRGLRTFNAEARDLEVNSSYGFSTCRSR